MHQLILDNVCEIWSRTRLDNIDYANLLNLVKSIGVTHLDALTFFVIHSNAAHFERLNLELEKMWESDRDEIVSSFRFIYVSQLNMWAQLSNCIDELIGEK